MAEPPTRARLRGDEVFQLLVESVKDYAIFLLDPDGVVLTWNEGARRIKGYEAEEVVGKNFSIFYPPADAKRRKQEGDLRIAAEEGRYEEEAWRVRKDGTRFWASVTITPLRDGDGALIGFAKVTRDLSERHRAEEERRSLLDLERGARLAAESALEQLKAVQTVTEAALAHLTLDDLLGELLERIAELLAADTAAVLLLDDTARVLVARAAKGLEEEVERGTRIPLGHGFAGRIAAARRPIVLDDVDHADVLNPLLREKGVRSLLGVPLLVQGRVLGVLHVGTLRHRRFTEDDVRFLQIVADRVALAIDHTRLYEAARQARQEAASATANLRARDEFLSIAAHELKTPMTAAKAAAQLLKARVSRSNITDATQLRAVEIVDSQIDKLARLVSLLLETVREQSGRFSLEREETDLAALLRRALEERRATTAHPIVLAAPDHLPALVDPLRIEQVLTNLLDNAIKFSPSGGPVEIALSRGGETTALLSVRDHGLGIPAEHRTRIFERFYQAHGDRSGMGLGLYITRMIVESHGGTIYAEFPPDGGSRFVVSLPLAADGTDPAEDPR